MISQLEEEKEDQFLSEKDCCLALKNQDQGEKLYAQFVKLNNEIHTFAHKAVLRSGSMMSVEDLGKVFLSYISQIDKSRSQTLVDHVQALQKARQEYAAKIKREETIKQQGFSKITFAGQAIHDARTKELIKEAIGKNTDNSSSSSAPKKP